MNHSSKRSLRAGAGLLLAGVAALLAGSLAIGCEQKMDPAECDKISQEAFALLGKGQPCGTDVDCKEATWPQCRRPTNTKNFDELAAMQKKRSDGKCEEKPKDACSDSPEVYCKQGLCTNREPGEIRDRD